MVKKNNPMAGKKHRAESKILMSKKKEALFDGEKNPMYGKHHTEEAKAKVAASRKNSVWIYKDMATKSVPADQLEIYLADGWTRGRAMDHRASEKYLLALLDKEKPVS
jgi:hypothetical protein